MHIPMLLRGWIPSAAALPLVLAAPCLAFAPGGPKAAELAGSPGAPGEALRTCELAVLGVARALPQSEPAAQRVRIPTEDQQTLAGTLFLPREAKHRAPGVVLVHGAGGSRAELQGLAVRLQKAGFAALTVDLRGHGENAAEALDWKNLDEEGRARTWGLAARDVDAAVELLLDQKGVHSTAISLIGHGEGCSLVSRQASRDERVRDIALLSPRVDQLGSTLLKDLVEVSGMPVYVAVGKDEAALAKRIGEATQKGAAAASVETTVAKADAAGLLADNKCSADLVRWMKARAAPAAKPAAESKQH